MPTRCLNTLPATRMRQAAAAAPTSDPTSAKINPSNTDVLYVPPTYLALRLQEAPSLPFPLLMASQLYLPISKTCRCKAMSSPPLPLPMTKRCPLRAPEVSSLPL
ncbi:hypothetical protein C8J57DRAFT_1264703 [Mycena rebaudengoi]|nr:hypothetical protein C8J57DRAFT_1264703 [Mycena rebaudengoi]